MNLPFFTKQQFIAICTNCPWYFKLALENMKEDNPYHAVYSHIAEIVRAYAIVDSVKRGNVKPCVYEDTQFGEGKKDVPRSQTQKKGISVQKKGIAASKPKPTKPVKQETDLEWLKRKMPYALPTPSNYVATTKRIYPKPRNK